MVFSFFIDTVCSGNGIHKKHSFEVCLLVLLCKGMIGLYAGNHHALGIPGSPVIPGFKGLPYIRRRELLGVVSLKGFIFLIFKPDMTVPAGPGLNILGLLGGIPDIFCLS